MIARWGAITGALIGIWAMAAAGGRTVAAAADADPGPRVARVAGSSGDVRIERRPRDESSIVDDPAYRGASLHPGDTIRTGPDEWVRLLVPGDLAIILEEETELIVAYQLSDRSSRPDDWLHFLTRGTAQISRGAALPLPFRMVTVAASVHLSGAGELRITAGRDSRTTVDVRRGTVEVIGSGGSMVVDEGFGATVVHGREPGKPEALTEDARERFERWDRHVLLDRPRSPRARTPR